MTSVFLVLSSLQLHGIDPCHTRGELRMDEVFFRLLGALASGVFIVFSPTLFDDVGE